MLKRLIIVFFVGFFVIAEPFIEIDTLIHCAIQEKVFPGAQVLIAHKGNIVYQKAFGNYAYDAQSSPVTCSTLFDLASVTKPFVTVATMLLCDSGKLSLEDHVSDYLPEFGCKGKENACIKDLLLHTSGIPGEVFFRDKALVNESFHKLLTCSAAGVPGEKHIYSSPNMIVLHAIIERVSGMPFDQFVYERITKPLGMHNTMFNPHDIQRCAPAGNSTLRPESNIQGVVHDDQAYILGGVAGHAGLFSTAADLAKLMQALLHGSLVKGETVDLWAKNHAFGWGYGWEIGRHLSPNAFGYFGWTGTSVWADKEQNVFCILLTNRTACGSQEGNLAIRKVRVAFHELLQQLLGLTPYVTPPVPVH